MTHADAPALACSRCGAPVAPGAATCDYCRTPLAWGATAPMTPTRSVRDAATRWARSVFGAPRKFAELITSVEVRDEVFQRLFTEIVRREIREERLPSRGGHRSSRRVDPNSVDPFGISVPDLRTASEYIATCTVCQGTGSGRCGSCNGSGRSRCGNCNGSGKERKYYKKSSRLVKCGVCRGGGTVACGGCGGGGTVPCRGCTGSGCQLAWLTYNQTVRATTSIEPQSPVLAAHKQLAQERALSSDELTAFGILASGEASGPLQPAAVDGLQPDYLRQHMRAVDPRLERVSQQQYLKLAVVRRDAAFEMCATRGVLVLSGNTLAGSSTREALRPVRRRLIWWTLLVLALYAATGPVQARLLHPGAYFARSNLWIGTGLALAFALTAIVAGGLLRELRVGFRVGRLSLLEKVLTGAAVLGIVVAGAIEVASRPHLEDVQRAIGTGDLVRATVVVEALSATVGDTIEVRDAEDSVLLAKANASTGESRLRNLDLVASRKGRRAVQAAKAARADRLNQIATFTIDKNPTAALNAIKQWFPGSPRNDPEVAEAEARAEDSAWTLCTDDFCRFDAARAANAAAPTTERGTRASAARDHILTSLVFTAQPAETTLARVKRLGVLGDDARKATAVAGSDNEILTKANAAQTLSVMERAKVALIGAEEPIISELIGSPVAQNQRVGLLSLGASTNLYVVHDTRRRCTGLYAVGADKGARAIGAASWTAPSLLSQAVGHPATVKKPTGGSSAARWFENGIPVVARWEGDTLIELRVGDASP